MPSFKYLLILIFLLIAFSNQTCCGNQSCPNNGYCICDPSNSIDSCAIQLSQNQANFIVNSTTSYYYFQPTVRSYSYLQAVFCGQNIPFTSNQLSYIVQNQNGGQYPNSSNSKGYTFQATTLCQLFPLSSINFKYKTNQKLQNLIFSLTLNVSGVNQNMSSTIVLQASMDVILVPILISFIGVLCIVGIVLIIYYIRKRCIKQKQLQLLQKNKFEHFQKYMPKQKFSDLNSKEVNQNCSVCLNFILEEEIIRKTPCDHIFHIECIDNWCKKNMNCPICRESFQLTALIEKFKKNTQIQERVWQMSKLDANLLQEIQIDEIQFETNRANINNITQILNK